MSKSETRPENNDEEAFVALRQDIMEAIHKGEGVSGMAQVSYEFAFYEVSEERREGLIEYADQTLEVLN